MTEVSYGDMRVNERNRKFLPFNSTGSSESLLCIHWGLAEDRTDVQSKERVTNE